MPKCSFLEWLSCSTGLSDSTLADSCGESVESSTNKMTPLCSKTHRRRYLEVASASPQPPRERKQAVILYQARKPLTATPPPPYRSRVRTKSSDRGVSWRRDMTERRRGRISVHAWSVRTIAAADVEWHWLDDADVAGEQRPLAVEKAGESRDLASRGRCESALCEWGGHVAAGALRLTSDSIPC